MMNNMPHNTNSDVMTSLNGYSTFFFFGNRLILELPQLKQFYRFRINSDDFLIFLILEECH